MKPTIHPVACIALLGAALLSACLSSRGGTQGAHRAAETGDSDAGEPSGDSDLIQELLLESIQTERRRGLLHVQFDLRNRRDSRLPLEWTLTWLDTGGAVVQSPHLWRPAILAASGSETLSGTASRPEAAGFKLGVRHPSGDR